MSQFHTNMMIEINTIIERELPGLPGWCTTEKASRLAELASGSEFVVELGVFGGRSLVALALGCSYSVYNERSCVHGIDPFTRAAALEGTNDPANDEYWAKLNYDDIAKSAQTAIYRLGLTRYAQLIRMRSLDVVDFYADGSLDLLHQDSNHSAEISCEEVIRWAPKIKPGGLWISDDIDWATTQRAQQLLIESGFERIEEHKTWAVSRKVQT